MEPIKSRRCKHCSKSFSIYHILIHKMKCRKEKGKRKTPMKKVRHKKIPNQILKKFPKKKKRKKKDKILNKSVPNEISKSYSKKYVCKKKMNSKKNNKKVKLMSKIKKNKTTVIKKKSVVKKKKKLDTLMTKTPKKKCHKCSAMISRPNFRQHISQCPYSRCRHCSEYFPDQIHIQHTR